MKKTTAILFLTLLVSTVLCISCNEPRAHLDPYGWHSMEHTFDSLTLEAENRFINCEALDSLIIPVRRMSEISSANPKNRQMKARTLFWQGRIEYNSGNTDEGLEMMRQALLMTDSAKYPYDYHRISWTMDMDYHEHTLERYRHLLNETEFFNQSGDKPVTAELAMETGTFLNDIGDTEHGIPYLVMADSLMGIAGLKEHISNNRINHANALVVQGDSTGAIRLFNAILSDKVNPVASRARDVVLGNLYELTGDTAVLYEAYALSRLRYNMEEDQCMYENRLAELKLGSGDMDSARYYHGLAGKNLEYVGRPDVRLDYIKMKYRLFDLDAKSDSAYKYLLMHSEIKDKITEENNRDEIKRSNLAFDIERSRLRADMEKRRALILFLSIIFAMVLFGGIIGICFYRRLQRQRLEKLRTSLDLERSNRKILAMQIVLEEKEVLLNKMNKEMKEMSKQGEISSIAAKKIGNSMKVHMCAEQQRESFMEIFENLSPDFASHIKSKYPDMTESDIRLASYIAIGMDNKHISRVMSIRPESVKQARWRLRVKIGLVKGESLDDFLKELAKES